MVEPGLGFPERRRWLRSGLLLVFIPGDLETVSSPQDLLYHEMSTPALSAGSGLSDQPGDGRELWETGQRLQQGRRREQDISGNQVQAGEAAWERWRRRSVLPGAGMRPGLLHSHTDGVLHRH